MRATNLHFSSSRVREITKLDPNNGRNVRIDSGTTDVLISTKLIIREGELVIVKSTLSMMYLYIARIYFYAHVRTFGRRYARRLHLYTDVLGTEIWRDPLDSTRLAIIQFIGLSKAPVHAVFPDRSLSLPLFLCLSPAPFRSLPSRFLSCRAYALSIFFSLSRIYRPSVSPPPPDITVFCLSSSRTVPLSRFSVSVRHAATLRSRPPAPFGVEND